MALDVKALIAEAAAGKPSEIDTGEGIDLSHASPDTDTEVQAGDSTTDDYSLEGDSGDTPSDSKQIAKAPGSDKAKPTESTSAKEVITVTDEQGRKRKVEIDYSDKDRIKKAFSMEAGARKWQADRDQAIQQVKGTQAKLAEVQGNWEKLDTAYTEKGVEGLFDLINGPGSFKSHIAKQVERAKFMESATPAQLKALEVQEASEATRRELEALKKDNESFKKKVQEEREVAETRSLESRIHPVFDKHRFADKLGDEHDEAIFDEMLWRTAMNRLEGYENEGVTITSELANKEFAEVARRIRNRIGAQAEKKAAKVITQKKQEATENVQSKVMSGYKSSDTGREARDLLNNGNLTGLMKNWSKYGSLFGAGKK